MARSSATNYVQKALDAHQLVEWDEFFDDDEDSPTTYEQYVILYRAAPFA